MSRATQLAALAAVVLAAAAPVPPVRAPERIQANENLQPAGALRDGVLRLRLDARLGSWHPDGDEAPGAIVPAFAERGGALRVPGPLVRVPAGTEVVVTLTNDVPGGVLDVHGLVSRPAAAGDGGAVVRVAAGETREVRFRLDAPGTYYYWGTTTGREFGHRTREDAQLSGAIVVDPAGTPAGAAPRDRILVLGMWSDTLGSEQTRGRAERGRLLFVVNGRSWPHTARLAYEVGDTIRWRVINTTTDQHPMHLHGFYYRIDARGDGTRDSTYDESRRDLAVTERMPPGRTMQVTWVPEREGNWLFHCHTPAHFGPRGPLGMPPAHGPHHAADHATSGMNGLVVGVTVAPRPGAPAERPAAEHVAPRRMRLLVRPVAGGTARSPVYTFALHERGAEPPPDTLPRAGPPLVLERGVPVEITVVNRTPEATAVHWHGIELESYFDGVPGFSGSGRRLSPLVAPADSFVVRFTPPRAGTFIYHTHVDELRQQPAGLAGAIVVVEPGHPLDPSTDTPVLVTSPRDSVTEANRVLVNGTLDPAPLDARAGTPRRLRLINMTVGRPGLRFELRRDTTLVAWRVVAKDGAELPVARRASGPSRLILGIGETADVEITPADGGDLRLELRSATGRVVGVQPIAVRPGLEASAK